MNNRRNFITESPTGKRWECRLGVDPSSIPHYSHNEHLPVLFYGGWASSFAPYTFNAEMLDYTAFHGAGDRPTLWYTREHWFQAHKPSPDPDVEAALRARWAIATAKGAWDAKALGNSRTAFSLVPGWDDGLSYAAMLEGIRIQMRLHDGLRELLLQTGDRFIAEVSAQGDMIWGIHDPATDRWDGKNLLGAALMEVRDEYC